MCGFDVRPVGLGCLGQRDHLLAAKRQRDSVGEQAAVEVGDHAWRGQLARVHLFEELAYALLNLAALRAVVKQRREVVLGEKADVLGEHRRNALEREANDVVLALRVFCPHAAIEPRDEVGDLARHLLNVDDLRHRARLPFHREERESLAVLR